MNRIKNSANIATVIEMKHIHNGHDIQQNETLFLMSYNCDLLLKPINIYITRSEFNRSNMLQLW